MKKIDYFQSGIKSEGHTPIYKMHKYFARRPHNVFRRLIEQYSPEGGLVVDCFGGGGVPGIADKKAGHTSILSDILDSLGEEFFQSLHDFALGKNTKKIKIPKSPRPYQEEILEDIKNGFKDSDRGKLIAACGIGKTLIALWLVEARNDQSVLFLAPSLQLIRQTLPATGLIR
jgi:hypothetical protein